MSFLKQIEHLLSLHPTKYKRHLPSITGVWQTESIQLILSNNGLFKWEEEGQEEATYGTFYFDKTHLTLNAFGQESEKWLVQKIKKQKYFVSSNGYYEYLSEAIFSLQDQSMFIEYNDLETERIAIAYRMVKLLNNIKF